jgi:hypothetical protein
MESLIKKPIVNPSSPIKTPTPSPEEDMRKSSIVITSGNAEHYDFSFEGKLLVASKFA